MYTIVDSDNTVLDTAATYEEYIEKLLKVVNAK